MQEVHVDDSGLRNTIAIGMSSDHDMNNTFPGWTSASFGYRAEDGVKLHNDTKGKQPFGPPFSTSDVVGCGIDFLRMEIFFTKNGKFIGTAFQNVSSTVLFPVVGLHSANEKVTINFGRRQVPFAFDIESYRESRKRAVARSILQQPFDKNIMTDLVESYLRHQGFEETLKAYQKGRRGTLESSRTALNATYPSHNNSIASVDTKQVNVSPIKDTTHISNSAPSPKLDFRTIRTSRVLRRTLNMRSTVRKFIVQGDCMAAMKLLETSCEAFLDAHTLIRMRIECQHFIELVRNRNITDAVVFARTRLSRYPAESVCDVVGLLAYEAPESSPLRHYLNHDYRLETANIVNAAVLTRFGIPQTPSLRLLLQHVSTTAEWTRELRHFKGPAFSLPS